jgi:hypothetical protein
MKNTTTAMTTQALYLFQHETIPLEQNLLCKLYCTTYFINDLQVKSSQLVQ